MLEESDIDFINNQFKEDMEPKDYRYTISYINGSPGLVVKGDDPAEAEALINDILPVYKRFKEAVVKGQMKAAGMNPKETVEQNNNSQEPEFKPCPIHNVPMKKRTGQYGVFYSHAKEDGSWCNGK